MYIGIDLGTSSIKLLLVDSNGDIIKTYSKEYPLIFIKNNWIEQDPSEWINTAFDGIKNISKGYEKDIKAISFSGQMHGLVLLDKYDNIIRPAILWCDQRTQKECDFLNNEINEDIIKLTGNKALTGFTAPKILWIKNNEPDNFIKISKIMLPKDYLAFKLSGVYSTDVSDASGTLLLDVENRIWSNKILDIIGIKKEQLPNLYESYEPIGCILPNIAKQLNLNEDIKIIAGAGDQAAGAVGVGAVNNMILSVALGTSGVVFANNIKYSLDKKARLHSFCHANGGYHQMGVMLSAAASLKWWVEDINKSKDYNTLVEEASNSKIDENLYFLPYLLGERTPHNDPNAKGTITGLNMNHNRGDITRAIIEGVNFGLKDSLDLIQQECLFANNIRVSGGGAKSDFWRQNLADIFNIQVDRVNSTEGPAFGAAILAMVGSGLFKDVNQACENLIKVVDSKIPNKENNIIYNKKHLKFKQLYLILKIF